MESLSIKADNIIKNLNTIFQKARELKLKKLYFYKLKYRDKLEANGCLTLKNTLYVFSDNKTLLLQWNIKHKHL